jgi:hypothetical protein
MLGSQVLDVALGVMFVFLLVGLLATAVREAIESKMKSRAVYLEKGIRELLGAESGVGMVRAFYEHPLIYSLYKGGYEVRDSRRVGGGLPTYIPSKNFADAIIDLAIRGPVQSEYGAAHTSPEMSVAALRQNASRLENPLLIRAVLTATDSANDDLSKARENLEAWFDSSMDRVSGWYKRTTHFWLFGIGLALAAGLNINTFRIADGLWRDKTLREALTNRSQAFAQDTAYQHTLRDSASRSGDLKRTLGDLQALTLPIGWSDTAKREAVANWNAGGVAFGRYLLLAFLGYILTALAVTLGAPFWFDLLNKFMVLRSTVKPHEKSPEEGSKDAKGRGKGPATTTNGSNAPSGPGGTGTISETGPPAGITTAGALVGAGAASGGEPNRWASGEDPDEGVI